VWRCENRGGEEKRREEKRMRGVGISEGAYRGRRQKMRREKLKRCVAQIADNIARSKRWS
jgi:hypothetical protein